MNYNQLSTPLPPKRRPNAVFFKFIDGVVTPLVSIVNLSKKCQLLRIYNRSAATLPYFTLFNYGVSHHPCMLFTKLFHLVKFLTNDNLPSPPDVGDLELNRVTNSYVTILFTFVLHPIIPCTKSLCLTQVT